MEQTTTKPHALTPEQIAANERWCELLESGNVPQCLMRMRNGECVCVLGAACLSLGLPIKSGQTELSEAGREALGLKTCDGEFGLEDSLLALNDGAGWSFPKIAAFIREQLQTNSKGLFIREAK